MIIVGITGILGAGKSTLAKYMVDKYGFVHYSARQFIAQELTRQGMPVTRDSLIEMGNVLRRENDPNYIISQLYQQAAKSGKNSVIESIRALGELEFLKKQKDFYLFSVTADPKVRYQRIQTRKSAADNVSFAEFLAAEKREMNSSDPAKQSIAACIKQADFSFVNNASLQDFYAQVDKVMSNLLPA